MQPLTPEIAQAIVDQLQQGNAAQIFQGSTQHPFRAQVIGPIALDTAQLSTQAYKIGFPFKAVAVLSASDTSVSINIRVGGQDLQNSPIALHQKDVLKFPYPISEAYLDWSAQAGKTITLLLLVDGEFNFGSTLISVTGGIFQQTGTAVASIASVTLIAATAAAIAPALSTRKTCTIQNNTGETLYVGGDNTVTADATATGGIQIPAGSSFQWQNTSVLYGICVDGGVVNRMEES